MCWSSEEIYNDYIFFVKGTHPLFNVVLARTLIKAAILTSTNVVQGSIIPVTVFCLQCRLYLIFACLACTVSYISYKAFESNLGKCQSLCTGVISLSHCLCAWLMFQKSKEITTCIVDPPCGPGLILCLSCTQIISLLHLTCFDHSKGQALCNVHCDMFGLWKTWSQVVSDSPGGGTGVTFIKLSHLWSSTV